MFFGIADYHASLKKRKVRGISSPWITPELKKKTNALKRQTKKKGSQFPTDVNWTSYKHLKIDLVMKLKMPK